MGRAAAKNGGPKTSGIVLSAVSAFKLGPLTIHYYGLTMVAAIVAAYFIVRKRALKFAENAKKLQQKTIKP